MRAAGENLPTDAGSIGHVADAASVSEGSFILPLALRNQLLKNNSVGPIFACVSAPDKLEFRAESHSPVRCCETFYAWIRVSKN